MIFRDDPVSQWTNVPPQTIYVAMRVRRCGRGNEPLPFVQGIRCI